MGARQRIARRLLGHLKNSKQTLLGASAIAASGRRRVSLSSSAGMASPRYLPAAWCAFVLAALCGCGSPGVPLPPSLDLPKPVTDLRAVRKGDKVYLMWTVP